jgi:hypothetical protein
MIHSVPKPKPKPKKRPKPMARKSRTKRQPPTYEAAAIPKGERVRDPEHIERVQARMCACSILDGQHCGGWITRWWQPGERTILSEASHVTNKGWGGGDNEVIPLCPNHHRLLACSWHVAGRRRFERMFGFNAAALAARLYDQTLALRGKATP